MALALAATLKVEVIAAPAKVQTDGREGSHDRGDQPLFPSILDDILPRWKMPHEWRLRHTALPWPLSELIKPSNVEAPGGPTEMHREEQHFLYFTGTDSWPQWTFAHTGILWSPGGLSNEGFTLKVLLNGGAYRYNSSALNDTTIYGRQYSLSVLPGWRLKREGYEVTIFAGLDYQRFLFIPDDPGSNLRGRHYGLRGGFELWHEPNSNTMLAADASISSIGAGNHARIAYGWRVFDKFYIGPEVQAYYTDPYYHKRAGVHVTAFRTEDREWFGAAGYASDNDNRSGIYMRVGFLVRR